MMTSCELAQAIANYLATITKKHSEDFAVVLDAQVVDTQRNYHNKAQKFTIGVLPVNDSTWSFFTVSVSAVQKA